MTIGKITATATPAGEMPPELVDCEGDVAEAPRLGVGTGAGGDEVEDGAAVVDGNGVDEVVDVVLESVLVEVV